MALSKSPGSVFSWLGSQPAIQIIRGLLLSPKPRHLRDLASQYELSPAGASDILRRLKKAGILKEFREGNRRCFALNVSKEELVHLTDLFELFERRLIEDRAARLNKDAIERFKWMDEAYQFYRGVKKLRHDPA
jgi:DNA-binding GntR family transcriptional regulator